MSPIMLLVKSVVVPAAVAALVMLVARPLRRGGVVAAVALALGYAAGHIAVAWPAFPPHEVTDRLVWNAAMALAAAIVVSLIEPTKWAVAGLLSQLILSAILGPVLRDLVQTSHGAVLGLALFNVLVLTWANLDVLARRVTAATLGMPLVIITFGAAAALTVSGSVVAGQFAAALGAALASVTALGAASSLRACAGPVFSPLLGGLLVFGYIYSELPASAGLLVVAAQVAPWAARIPALARRPAWQGVVIASLLAAVPVGMAVALSFGEPSPYRE